MNFKNADDGKLLAAAGGGLKIDARGILPARLGIGQ